VIRLRKQTLGPRADEVIESRCLCCNANVGFWQIFVAEVPEEGSGGWRRAINSLPLARESGGWGCQRAFGVT
jgi:hypothetical protein